MIEVKNPKNIKEIKVHNPDNLDTVDYKKLKPLQGDLKETDEKKISKLISSIIKNGFIVPKFVWKDNSDYFIMDGHQTKKALKHIDEAGIKIPKIPYVNIKAKNKKDAAKKILYINSRYGDVNDGTTFFLDFDIDVIEDELDDINIPELDYLFDDFEDVDTDVMSEEEDDDLKLNKCPKCGFEWKT